MGKIQEENVQGALTDGRKVLTAIYIFPCFSPTPADQQDATLDVQSLLSDRGFRSFIKKQLKTVQSVDGGLPPGLGAEQSLKDVLKVKQSNTMRLSGRIPGFATYKTWANILSETHYEFLLLLVIALAPAKQGEFLIEPPKVVKMLKMLKIHYDIENLAHLHYIDQKGEGET